MHITYKIKDGVTVMDLSGFVMDLESLINRYTILVVIKVLSFFLFLFFIWLLPYIGKPIKNKYKKRKTKRKIKIEKQTKIKTIFGQIVISVLFLAAGIFIIGDDVSTLNSLKKDLNQNSVVIYEGNAHLWDDYLRTGVFFDFFVDSRNVTLGDSNDTYKIDMSKTDEGWVEDSGDFYGKITYGENSKFILRIE